MESTAESTRRRWGGGGDQDLERCGAGFSLFAAGGRTKEDGIFAGGAIWEAGREPL